MNTVDALKKLYKTLAGKDYAGDPNPTDAEMIDAIAKDATSGGGSGGGVAEPMVVTVTHEANPSDSSQFTDYLGNTWQEIADAYLAGRNVLCLMKTSDDSNGDRSAYQTIISIGSGGVGSEFPSYTATILGPDMEGYPGIVFRTSDPNGRPRYSNV